MLVVKRTSFQLGEEEIKAALCLNPHCLRLLLATFLQAYISIDCEVCGIGILKYQSILFIAVEAVLTVDT